jgi:phosphoglycolate phosphatase
MIAAILFDKDGCLLDFDKTWGQWAKSLLGELADGYDGLLVKLADAVGYRLESECFDPESAVIAGTPEDGVRLLLPFLPNWTHDNLLSYSNESAANAPLAPVVPLAPLLDQMRGTGLKLGVATNDSEATARAHMNTLGVADRFDMILGSDSGYGGKPAPGMQNAFTSQVGVESGRCIMVGDSLHDLHSGRAAGMISVGVLTGPASRAELEPDADVVLPDIGHLPDWIKAQAGLAKNDA